MHYFFQPLAKAVDMRLKYNRAIILKKAARPPSRFLGKRLSPSNVARVRRQLVSRVSQNTGFRSWLRSFSQFFNAERDTSDWLLMRRTTRVAYMFNDALMHGVFAATMSHRKI